MSSREQGKYWLKDDGVWTVAFWDGHCWEDGTNFGLQDSDYDEIGPLALDPDAMRVMKAQWQREALEECFNDCRQLEASPAKIMKAHIDRRASEAAL